MRLGLLLLAALCATAFASPQQRLSPRFMQLSEEPGEEFAVPVAAPAAPSPVAAAPAETQPSSGDVLDGDSSISKFMPSPTQMKEGVLSLLPADPLKDMGIDVNGRQGAFGGVHASPVMPSLPIDQSRRQTPALSISGDLLPDDSLKRVRDDLGPNGLGSPAYPLMPDVNSLLAKSVGGSNKFSTIVAKVLGQSNSMNDVIDSIENGMAANGVASPNVPSPLDTVTDPSVAEEAAISSVDEKVIRERDAALAHVKLRAPRIEALERSYEKDLDNAAQVRHALDADIEARRKKGDLIMKEIQKVVAADKEALKKLNSEQAVDAKNVNVFNAQLRHSEYLAEQVRQKRQLDQIAKQKAQLEKDLSSTASKIAQTKKILGLGAVTQTAPTAAPAATTTTTVVGPSEK